MHLAVGDHQACADRHRDKQDWLDDEFHWAERTAYKFIAVAQAVEGKLAPDANLQIDANALFLLIEPGTTNTMTALGITPHCAMTTATPA